MRLPPRIRGPLCDADDGDVCYGGDVDGACRHLSRRCRRLEENVAFVAELEEVADRWPGSAVALTQAVYAAVKLGFQGPAERSVERCMAAGPTWWCLAASGYAAQRFGHSAEAHEAFQRALRLMPDAARCRFLDVTALVASKAAERLSFGGCSAVTERQGWFWWLSDPFLAADHFNDRWTEHMARVFEGIANEDLVRRRGIRLHNYGFRPKGFSHRHLRRGLPDSWSRTSWPNPNGYPNAVWTSRRAAFNHFVPEVFALDSLHPELEYRLEARLERGPGSDEGYTRPGGRVFEMPVQHARFLEGDSMVVAVAARLTELEIGGPGQAFFMASTGPGDVVTLDPSPLRETVVFAGKVANRRQVVGIEVLTPGDDARSREVIEPLPEGTPLLSDLLLYRPLGADEPATRIRAAGVMHGTTRIPKERELGLYWEGYGMGGGIELEASLRLEPVGGGFFGGLAQALGFGGADGTGTVTWTVTTPEEGRFSDAVTLDLSGLDEAAYELVLTMTTPDGTTVERRRRFEVVEGAE